MRYLALAVTLLLTTTVTAQRATAPSVADLQGRWEVTSGEHDGKPMPAIVGGIMTIAGDQFQIRTASGNVLRGSLSIIGNASPSQLDLVHADGSRWEAIFEVTQDTFRLNYVDAGGMEPRPTTFTTSEKTEASIVALKRSKP